jgi:hypothetical protein
MRKIAAVALMATIATLAPVMSGAALAAKSCPEGSHPGKGPDPTKVYCFDNLDPTKVVKIFNA